MFYGPIMREKRDFLSQLDLKETPFWILWVLAFTSASVQT